MFPIILDFSYYRNIYKKKKRFFLLLCRKFLPEPCFLNKVRSKFLDRGRYLTLLYTHHTPCVLVVMSVEEELFGDMVQSSYFDIKYLLGGSEKRVKECFLTCTPLEMAARQSAPRDRFTIEVPEVRYASKGTGAPLPRWRFVENIHPNKERSPVVIHSIATVEGGAEVFPTAVSYFPILKNDPQSEWEKKRLDALSLFEKSCCWARLPPQKQLALRSCWVSKLLAATPANSFASPVAFVEVALERDRN